MLSSSGLPLSLPQQAHTWMLSSPHTQASSLKPVSYTPLDVYKRQVHSIVMNNFDAGRLATQALIRAGHTRIGHITSRISFGNTDDRERGYRAAMEAQGLCCPPQALLRVTPTLEGAYGDMRSILEENRPLPTAFFAANDIMAMGCLRALAERGIRVPEDVSLIGIDVYKRQV